MMTSLEDRLGRPRGASIDGHLFGGCRVALAAVGRPEQAAMAVGSFTVDPEEQRQSSDCGQKQALGEGSNAQGIDERPVTDDREWNGRPHGDYLFSRSPPCSRVLNAFSSSFVMREDFSASCYPNVVANGDFGKEVFQDAPAHRSARDLGMQDESGHAAPVMCAGEFFAP